MSSLRLTELVDVPWKNGGGITRNIAVGRCGNHVAWRLSRADVGEDGVFSNFEGLTRILTVVSGGGMVLEHSTGNLVADLWMPVRFDGSLKINAHLNDGALSDLNLMFDPTICEGKATILSGHLSQHITHTASGCRAFHVLSGTPRFNGERLDSGDTYFVMTHGVGIELAQDDTVLELSLQYHDHISAITLCIAER